MKTTDKGELTLRKVSQPSHTFTHSACGEGVASVTAYPYLFPWLHKGGGVDSGESEMEGEGVLCVSSQGSGLIP